MKRHAIIVSMATGHTDSEIAAFLKVAQSFVYKVQREMEAVNGDVAALLQRKQYCLCSGSIRMSEFVSCIQVTINEELGKSMRALAKELHVDNATTQCVVYEGLS